MREITSDPMNNLIDVVVLECREEAQDIVVIELGRPDGAALPTFEAGAHIDIYISENVIRQYSLCNDPGERHRYVIGVLRDPQSRGGSIEMHRLRPGNHIRIGAPRNAFPLDSEATKKLLIAGGIGITPIKAMMHSLMARNIDFELHYFSRSASSAAFRSLFQQPPFQDKVTFYFDDEGHALPLSERRLSPGHANHIYICGPSGFIERVRNDALERGFAHESIHIEHFVSQPSANGASFTVEAVRSGVTVTVSEDETIAQALEKAGLEVLTSCEQGLCGVCLTTVLDGVPHHQDDVQSEAEKEENSRMAICCSRSRTPVLRLDI